MSTTLFAILAAIVLAAGFAARRRVRRSRVGDRPIVGDDVLRSILDDDDLRALEESDPLQAEELDEDEIRRAEDEFWEGEWDQDPEDWRG